MHARELAALVLATTFLAAITPVFAHEDPPEFELPEVTSPGRRPQPAAVSPASVTVLTSEELQRLGVRTVGEAIGYVPETLSRSYGGPGSLITASIRGSSAEQVLVLLDGVPVNGVLAGTVDLSTFPIDAVERIEILRGPFSAIYGSGAVGGVISIITRRRSIPTLTIGAGSLGTFRVAATGGGSSSSLSAQYGRTDGHRPNSDAQGEAVALRVGGTRRDVSWDASLFGSSISRGTPGSVQFPTPLARQEDEQLVAVVTGQRTRASTSDRLRLSVRHLSTAYQDPTFGIDDRQREASWSAEWQRTHRPQPEHAVTVGADAVAQYLDSTSVGVRSAVIGAAYAQDDRALGPRAVLSLGLRADWDSAYGAQLNPRAGIVYFVTPDLRARAAVGRTFRGPSFAELYYPFDGFAQGNPDLKPEHAWSADLGVEWQISRGLLGRAVAFWSQVSDLILFTQDASLIFTPQNIGEAAVRGLSAELHGRLAPAWTTRTSLTYMRASNVATGLDLPYRPRLLGSAGLTYELSRTASVTATAQYAGQRYADTGNTLPLPAYLTVGFVAQTVTADGFTARVSVQNLFNARYEPVQGYPAPGRTIYGEIAVRQ